MRRKRNNNINGHIVERRLIGIRFRIRIRISIRMRIRIRIYFTALTNRGFYVAHKGIQTNNGLESEIQRETAACCRRSSSASE